MSDKIRVMFDVPDGTKNAKKLREPVYISLEDYVDIRVQEKRGNKHCMAYCIQKNFLGNVDLDVEGIKMTTAVGNPLYIIEIDEAIEAGNIEVRNGKIVDISKKEDDCYTDENGYTKKRISSDNDSDKSSTSTPSEPNFIDRWMFKRFPSWERVSENNRHFAYAMTAVAIILILLVLVAVCLPDEKKEKSEGMDKMENFINSFHNSLDRDLEDD